MAQKPIGPSFFDELAAAGLNGLPFSWSADGSILFGDAMTPGQIAAVEAVYAAHDPTKPAPVVPVPPTPRQWLERLSPATQLGLETAALSNAQVALWLRKATGAGSIDVTLAETQQGVAAMVAVGLLTAADQATLLAP